MKKVITISLVLLVSVGIAVLLTSNKKTLDSKNVLIDRSHIAVSVTLRPVQIAASSSELSMPATLLANEEATISAAASGRISSLSFDLGTRVTKGSIIGRLDVKEAEIKLRSAQLAIEKLRRDYERNKVLTQGNATNANAVQDSKYDLDVKILEAEQLEKQISYGNLIAPVGGMITAKTMKVGEFANTGAAVGTVVDVSSLKAQVYVPESSIFDLTVGQKSSITTDVFPGETFIGTVTYISPKGDENHNYLVELSVQNNTLSQLKAGVYALIKFTLGHNQKALQIPKTALVNGVKNPSVFVAEGDRAIERKIVVGSEVGENIEVLEGLTESERVIISGQINIVNGSLIKEIGQ